MEVNKEKIIQIFPQKGETSMEQLYYCLSRVSSMLNSFGLDVNNILKQTVFLKANDYNDYFEKKEEFITVMTDFYKCCFPPTSFIAQKPEKNKYVAMELILWAFKSEKIELSHKIIEDARYTVINLPGFKKVFAAGLTAFGNEKCRGTSNRAKSAFELMTKILKEEEMTFSDVVHQWNYIENILGNTTDKGSLRQNYQDFNEVRTSYYEMVDFINGYPAATGIGMNAGGVILDFIAVKGLKDISIIPVRNPQQVDAHKYSGEVLIGDLGNVNSKKASPKFERAKYLSIHNSHQVFISGTAAILGQDSVGQDIEKQTIITIENILKLISEDNLKDSRIEINRGKKSFAYLRAYVKHEMDIPQVRRICEKYFKDIPVLYLVADICRDSLLVEIEGAVQYK